MTGGYLYVLWNPVYETYGQDVYKLGKTQNLPQRKNGYITPYIDDSLYKYTSPYFDDMDMAEQLVFVLLKKYRIKKQPSYAGRGLQFSFLQADPLPSCALQREEDRLHCQVRFLHSARCIFQPFAQTQQN